MIWTDIVWPEIGQATIDTLVMSASALVFTVLLGLPLGVLLFLSGKRQLLQQRALNAVLSLVVNFLRSVPFIILLIIMIPLTVLVDRDLHRRRRRDSTPGTRCCAVLCATWWKTCCARWITAWSRLARPWAPIPRQIILGALLPEALPGLLAAVTVTAIALVSYSAMAGAIGGGGLGDLAIRYGYQRFQPDVMVITVLLMVFLVQLLQIAGDRLVLHFTRH